MQQILSDFSLASAFAFIALVLGCAHTQQTENLPSAASFRTVIGGTSRIAGATGKLSTIGVLNTNQGKIVLRYLLCGIGALSINEVLLR